MINHVLEGHVSVMKCSICRRILYSKSKEVSKKCIIRAQLSSMHKILRQKLHMKAYKTQLHQKLLGEDYYAWLTFCHQFNEKPGNDDVFVSSLLFSDEATFHISGKVNRHNCQIWGTENPNETVEHKRVS